MDCILIEYKKVKFRGEVKAEITLPIPPMLNEQTRLARSHWSKSSETKREWTDLIELLVKQLPKFSGEVWIDFLWQPSNRRCDPDNIAASAKYIMDGLVNAGVIRGDSLTTIQSPILHRYERGKHQVILTISDSPIWSCTPIQQHCNR